MISLLVLVFLVNLAIYLLNTIGASTINNLLWILYMRLPTPVSRDAQEHYRLKREVVQLKREMNATSSQDEFAKWAKLRRRHDKTLEEYEAKNKAILAKKTSFDWTVKTARWLSTTGFRLYLQFNYAKTPMFELPPGWMPYSAEWVLSFPRAPLGTVSIQVWSAACATVISLTGEGVASIVKKAQSREAEPMPSGRGSGKSEAASKKEL